METARSLAAHGAHVVGAARDLKKAEAATSQVRKDAAAKGGGFELIELDLASLNSVRACADALLEKGKLSDAGVRNMISLDRQARIYRRELGLGPRRRASRPAAPKPEPKPKVEVEPASEPEPEPESDLVGYLQRKANGGTSP